MKNRLPALAVLTVLAAIFQSAAAEIVREPILDRKVNHLYLQAGPTYKALPELIAQLEVPAGINLGYISAIKKEVEYPPHFGEPGKPPASEWSPEFEFKSGTVREALNAYALLNPQVRWTTRNGRIILKHSNPQSTPISVVMKRKLGEVKILEEPFGDSIAQFSNILDRDLGDVAKKFEFIAEENLVENEVFDLRTRIQQKVSIDLNALSIEECLDHYANALGDNAMWCAAESAPGSDDEGTDRAMAAENYVAFITNWHTKRSSMPLGELIPCADYSNPDMHDYASKVVRAEDARLELARRLRSDPNTVRPALLDHLKLALKHKGKKPFSMESDYLSWLFSLADNELTRKGIESVLSIEDPEYQKGLIQSTFARPDDPQYKSHFHDLWVKMMESDDAKVVWLANYTLEWSKARDRYLMEKKLNP